MYSFNPPFWPFIAFRVNGWYWASLSNTEYPSLPLPSNCSSASEICWNAKGLIIFMCHLNIRKHRPWAYILGFIELPYFGSEQFRKIYLVERICICIWINVFVFVFVFVFESMLNKIFVFVFVFEKSKFLYLYLIKRIWPQPCWQPCWIYDYDYDFWRNDECGRCLPKKALSLLTIMLDKYIHRCVFYPSGTIQKLSDLLSLLSLMLFSSVPLEFWCWSR